MKRLFFIIAAFVLLVSPAGYCDAPAVRVELTTSEPEISFDQGYINAHFTITNVSGKDIQFPNLESPLEKGRPFAFHSLLMLDDPAISFSLNKLISNPSLTTLKPGQSVSEDFNVTLDNRNEINSSVTFKLGFKISESSDTVWSNPIRIQYRNGEASLPVKVEIFIKNSEMYFETGAREGIFGKPGMPGNVIHIRITNISTEPQNIGNNGPQGLYTLVSDNKSIGVASGGSSMGRFAILPIVLKPDETWEQSATIYYEGKKPISEPITFRIGVKNTGYKPTWGNPLTINIKTPPQNGVLKLYSDEGELQEERTYKDGFLNGSFKLYVKGKLVSDNSYFNGLWIGDKNYNADGTLHADIKLIEGNKDPASMQVCAEADSDQTILKITPPCR